MNKKNPAKSTIDTSHMSYEEARAQLVEIVTRLEQGSIPLEESLSLWNLGEQLANRCEQLLAGAQKRLDDARVSKEPENIDTEENSTTPGKTESE